MIGFLVAVLPAIVSVVQFLMTLAQLFPEARRVWRAIETAKGAPLGAKDRRDIVAGVKQQRIFQVSGDGGKTWIPYDPSEGAT